MLKRKVENLKGGIAISEKDYLELLKIKERLEEILASRKKVKRKKAFERAFGILKDSFKGKNSLKYVIRLRKAWRK